MPRLLAPEGQEEIKSISRYLGYLIALPELEHQPRHQSRGMRVVDIVFCTEVNSQDLSVSHRNLRHQPLEIEPPMTFRCTTWGADSALTL